MNSAKPAASLNIRAGFAFAGLPGSTDIRLARRLDSIIRPAFCWVPGRTSVFGAADGNSILSRLNLVPPHHPFIARATKPAPNFSFSSPRVPRLSLLSWPWPHLVELHRMEFTCEVPPSHLWVLAPYVFTRFAPSHLRLFLWLCPVYRGDWRFVAWMRVCGSSARRLQAGFG